MKQMRRDSHKNTEDTKNTKGIQGFYTPCSLRLCAFVRCLIVYLIFPLSFAFAEVNFRAMPAVNVPLGKDHFSAGFGAAASLDWAFLSLNNKWTLGLSAVGGFVDFPVEQSDSFTLFQGGAGPFAGWRINDRFSFRAGINAGVYQYSWESESNAKFFAGGSLSTQYHLTPQLSLFADVGYNRLSFSESQPINNFRGGVGIQLNLSEILRPQSRLRGERTEQYHVFPVSFAWYEHNALAMLQITNEEPNTIRNIELSFLLERYMNQPSPFAHIASLAPGETVEIPVIALFNESMLSLTESVNASSQIIAEYRSLGITKTSGFSMQMPVSSRNSMTWDDDRRAASFVSARDPAAVYFARYVSSSVSNATASTVPQSVRLAAALFEALRLYGISYLVDPASSYVALSENTAAADTLNYPYETLLYRGGDCDDLSILFASMLEVLGIESAFITVPGHIYIAFNIGDANWRGGNTDIIEHDGKRWLPVEITVPDRGFAEACRTGARQWNSAGDKGCLYPMRESWRIYPSVSVNAAGDNMPAMPERAAIIRALETELGKIR